MRVFVRGCAALAVLAVAVPVAAQNSPPAADPSEIVVTGDRQERDRQIRGFIRALTDVRVRGQISRFNFAVCPAAVGLSRSQNEAVAIRMRRVAEAAGIRRAEAACTPNVLVVVTRDKRDFIEGLRREYPAFFREMTRRDFRQLARQSGPAAAWHIEGLVNADGLEVPRDVETGYSVMSVTDTPSRLRAASRPHFIAAVVVVEVAALAGLTTMQLADYAAMRAFARTDPTRLAETPASTILTVLDAPMDSLVPNSLTHWDLGFLRGLYASDPNRYATQQRGEIGRTLRDELEDAADAEPQ